MEITHNLSPNINNLIGNPTQAIKDYAESYKDIPLIDDNNSNRDKVIEIFKGGAKSGIREQQPRIKYRFDCPFHYNDPNGNPKTAKAKDLGPSFNARKGVTYDKCAGGEVEGTTTFSYTRATDFDIFHDTKLLVTPNIKIRFEEIKTVLTNIYLRLEGSITIALKCKNADGSTNNIDVASVPLFYEDQGGKVKAGTCKIRYIFGIHGESTIIRQRVAKEIVQLGQKRTEYIGLWRTADGTSLVEIFENGTYVGDAQTIMEFNPEKIELLVVGGQETFVRSLDKTKVIRLITQCAISSIEKFEGVTPRYEALNKEKWVKFGGDAEAYKQLSCQNNFLQATSLNIFDSEWLIGKDATESNILTINSAEDLL